MKKSALTVHVNCRGNDDERDDDNRPDQRHTHLITTLKVKRNTSHTLILVKITISHKLRLN